MFKVRHLSKTFSSRSKTIKALDDMNFTLPNKGMVFITGKSGSGKSTLLNILGTLETPSEGEIYYNNLNLSELNSSKSASFRNEVIGFMFQDFCLLEDLTVYQNVSLSLELQCRQNIDEIDTILKKLDLYDFRNTKVIKLSVGQKERVAIARAVVKKPKVILCDEPTGNLDSFNSEIILDYLKELSKDILIIIITHNLIEAYKYADRVLELSEGKIVKDSSYQYNKKEALKINETLYLNELRRVNSLTKLEINNEINKGNIKDVRHIETLFTPTDNKKLENIEFEETKLKKKRLGFFNLFKWEFNLFKKEYLRNFLYTVLSAFLIVAFSLTFVLINNPGENLSIKMMDEVNLPLYNVTKYSEAPSPTVSHSIISNITREEKAKLDVPYYPVSNYTITHRSGENKLKRFEVAKAINNFDRFYSSSSYGTLYNIKKEDILKIFNDPSVYIEEVAPYKKEGVYLTDYVVDAYRFYVSRGFVAQGDIPYPNVNFKNGYCNGIIYTNYKNKYRSILTKLDHKTLFLKDADPKEVRDFIEFASRYLAIAYNLEPNFNELIRNPLINDYQGVQKAEVLTKIDEKDVNVNLKEDYFFYIPSVNDDEGLSLSVSVDILNNGLKVNKTFEEWNEIFINNETTLRLFESDLEKFYDLKVKVRAIRSMGLRASKDLLKVIQDYFLDDYALYFLKANDTIKAIDKLNDERFKFITLNDEAITYVTFTLRSFTDFFSFFMIILFIATIGILLILGTHNVKALKYKIGILKGIGISTSDLTSFYIINIAMISLVFVSLFFPLLNIFNNLGNNIFSAAIKEATSAIYLDHLVIFEFNPLIISISLSIMIISLVLSISLSLIKVNKIKPIDILKRI